MLLRFSCWGYLILFSFWLSLSILLHSEGGKSTKKLSEYIIIPFPLCLLSFVYSSCFFSLFFSPFNLKNQKWTLQDLLISKINLIAHTPTHIKIHASCTSASFNSLFFSPIESSSSLLLSVCYFIRNKLLNFLWDILSCHDLNGLSELILISIEGDVLCFLRDKHINECAFS